MCRLLLAALHYNENADRKQATNSSGKLQYSIRFPKYKKGEYTLVPIKEEPTHGQRCDTLKLCVLLKTSVKLNARSLSSTRSR